MRNRARALGLLALMLAAMLLASCGGGGTSDLFESNGKPKLSDESYQRQFGPLQLAVFNEGSARVEASGAGTARLDTSNANKGYIGVSLTSSVATRVQVQKIENGQVANGYAYVSKNNGEVEFFPLAYGSGSYIVRLLSHRNGESYDIMMEAEVEVALQDEFAPFLVQSSIINYGEGSRAVTLGRELAEHCVDDLEVIRQVYYWITSNISYDTDKVALVSTNAEYVPDLDSIIASGKGICYDYASLAAAMLRSNGIPTRLIMGNVRDEESSTGTIYHAWNEVYTEETGWIAVRFEVSGKEWNRVDTTFAAGASNSSISQFIGDGNNYFPTTVH